MHNVKVQQSVMFAILDFINFKIFAFQVVHLVIMILQIHVVLVRLVVLYVIQHNAMFVNIIIFCKENYVTKFVLMDIIHKLFQMVINALLAQLHALNVHQLNVFNVLIHIILKKESVNHVEWENSA